MLRFLHLLNKMDINKRFLFYVDKVANSKAAFSKTTGISSVILSHIGSGRNKVSLTAVIQILEAYPSINAEYLLLGKGSPFKTTDSNKIIEIVQAVRNIQSAINVQNKQLNQQIESVVNQISTD